jgi:hypothetical protein
MAAPQFRIPEEFKSGFTTLIKLNDSQFDQLKDVLRSTKSGELDAALSQDLVASLGLKPMDALTLGVTIISVYRLLFQTTGSVAEVSLGLEAAFRSTASPASEQIGARLRSRLSELLSLHSNLFYTIKSLALFDESDAVFVDCRVISDIRLAFDNRAVSDGYKTGMVVHNFKLGYRQNGELLHLIVSCHGNDLEQLRAAIDRALEKEKAIREGDLGRSISFIDKK